MSGRRAQHVAKSRDARRTTLQAAIGADKRGTSNGKGSFAETGNKASIGCRYEWLLLRENHAGLVPADRPLSMMRLSLEAQGGVFPARVSLCDVCLRLSGPSNLASHDASAAPTFVCAKRRVLGCVLINRSL